MRHPSRAPPCASPSTSCITRLGRDGSLSRRLELQISFKCVELYVCSCYIYHQKTTQKQHRCERFASVCVLPKAMQQLNKSLLLKHVDSKSVRPTLLHVLGIPPVNAKPATLYDVARKKYAKKKKAKATTQNLLFGSTVHRLCLNRAKFLWKKSEIPEGWLNLKPSKMVVCQPPLRGPALPLSSLKSGRRDPRCWTVEAHRCARAQMVGGKGVKI
jgi:hypothetical protein